MQWGRERFLKLRGTQAGEVRYFFFLSFFLGVWLTVALPIPSARAPLR